MERQVAELAARGLLSKEIARRLYMSERTVHAHLRHAYAKTGTAGGPGARGRLAEWLRRETAM